MAEDTEILRVCSEQMQDYFTSLQHEMERAYAVARAARARGYDPELEPEIPPAKDLAARVEKLVGPRGVAPLIRKLTKEYAEKGGARELVSLEIARSIAKELVSQTSNRELAIDQAIRTGLAIITEGILVAPLEGVANVKIGQNSDGTNYVAVSYAGPIRSAGGTAQALSILIADMVRRELGIGAYKPTENEVNRYKEEIPLYSQVQRSLQYKPSQAEIDLIVRNCPVCIDGEGTEKVEVSGYRDLPRVETNRIRGGMALVLTEGLCLKAQKIQKHVKNLKIEGWEFIDDYINRMKGAKPVEPGPVEKPLTRGYEIDTREPVEGEEGQEGEEDEKDPDIVNDDLPRDADDDDEQQKAEITEAEKEVVVKPETKYLKDLPAGRPVLSHPSRPGGFRLRYGRSRATGLAAIAMHPVTMHLLDSFLAVGTQVKIERPGKAGVVTNCDSIEGPIVQLHSGDLVEINTVSDFKKLKMEINKIIDVGEILIPFGEFVENNHVLIPGAYCTEWWIQELAEAKGESICAHGFCSDDGDGSEKPLYPTLQDVRHTRKGEGGNGYVLSNIPSVEAAFKLAEEHRIPLHPYYNLFWHDIEVEKVRYLCDHIREHGEFDGSNLTIDRTDEIKNILVLLGALHKDHDGKLVVGNRYSSVLLRCLGLNARLQEARPWPEAPGKKVNVNHNGKGPTPVHHDTMELVSQLAGITIKPRAPTRIGARMGRPEKAKERVMSPAVHALFPIGHAGGVQRLVNDAIAKANIEVEVGMRKCPHCGNETFQCRCKCGSHTMSTPNVKKQGIKFNDYCRATQIGLNEDKLYHTKAVIGLISENKTPEALEKGLLRAKHEVNVFKDGTIRFDMTDVPLSHFKPFEIGTNVETLKRLGYCYDIWGDPLVNENQVIELKVQDIVPSRSCGKYFVKTAKFIDDLLVKLYEQEPFYNVTRPEQLIGHLTIGLAPHTSGGVLSRIIGFTEANVGFAHPYYHAAKRRNCDGDEDCVILLMDGLLNFSRSFLPSSRGGQMDAPLVLTTHIEPSEIDKEAHNVDVSPIYPLEFYRAAERFAYPKEVQDYVEIAGARLGREEQYEGMGYTHDITNINDGPKDSNYKLLEKMIDKIEAQLNVGRMLRAVDEKDVASRVIESHFLKDMIGNLKKFGTQQLRCTKCNQKYRRVPLAGVCTKPTTELGTGGNGRSPRTCGGNLTLTVHEGSVKKYLEISKKISEKYDVSEYTRQRITLLEHSINSLFENDKVKKCQLEDFL